MDRCSRVCVCACVYVWAYIYIYIYQVNFQRLCVWNIRKLNIWCTSYKSMRLLHGCLSLYMHFRIYIWKFTCKAYITWLEQNSTTVKVPLRIYFDEEYYLCLFRWYIYLCFVFLVTFIFHHNISFFFSLYIRIITIILRQRQLCVVGIQSERVRSYLSSVARSLFVK